MRFEHYVYKININLGKSSFIAVCLLSALSEVFNIFLDLLMNTSNVAKKDWPAHSSNSKSRSSLASTEIVSLQVVHISSNT